MNNKTDIGLIDSHAKSDGRNNDINTFHEEIVLRLRARGTIEPCMIRSGADVVGLQYGRQLLHFLTRQTIDNATLSLVLPDKFHEDRKSTRLNSSHANISYAVFCLK